MKFQIEKCAQAAHEVNRAYCAAIGDYSQVSWEQAPEWQRESSIRGVQGVLAGNGPEEQHQAWLDDKIANGWKHGPVKNPEKKEHPCMVPYAWLPEEQRAKDLLYVTTVRTMAAALGLPIKMRDTTPATAPAIETVDRQGSTG